VVVNHSTPCPAGAISAMISSSGNGTGRCCHGPATPSATQTSCPDVAHTRPSPLSTNKSSRDLVGVIGRGCGPDQPSLRWVYATVPSERGRADSRRESARNSSRIPTPGRITGLSHVSALAGTPGGAAKGSRVQGVPPGRPNLFAWLQKLAGLDTADGRGRAHLSTLRHRLLIVPARLVRRAGDPRLPQANSYWRKSWPGYAGYLSGPDRPAPPAQTTPWRPADPALPGTMACPPAETP
jgi:hypothetical protein